MRDFRPDVVLELAPHSALQPSITQCLESSASSAVSIPTLRRDTDVCLGFHEALGALFRAGVELDFAAQYPRPEPVTHLLPGYPRNEQTAADEMSDDEMFLQAGEYAHGPLIGHRVPCDHLLFEARMSERDFPWLAEHRVHHASIMPAAGYIELLLQAFGGAPLHVESLEFLQPCPIPKTPVRLQTELFPVAGAPELFTFTISSRAYDVDAKSELHSRGTLRLVSADYPVDVPPRLTDVDTSTFEPYYYVGESDFYERIDASLGETFQYGPYFRNIQRVLWEDTTANYLFDVEMDERLWMDGREEGYVANPALLDGGLQIFLYHLLRATDIFAMPRRAVGVTFLRPPTGPRLTCYVKKDPDWADINEQGQFTERRGERSGGSIRFYDSDTGDLVLCIDAYVSFNSNPSWNDRPHSKHAVSWQPKFVPEARALLPRLADGDADGIEPAALIAALEQPGAGGGTPYALPRDRGRRHARPRAGHRQSLPGLPGQRPCADRILAARRHRRAGARALRRVPQPRRRPAFRGPGPRRRRGAGAPHRPAAATRRRDPAAARRGSGIRPGAVAPAEPAGGAGRPGAGLPRRRRGRAGPRLGPGGLDHGYVRDAALTSCRRRRLPSRTPGPRSMPPRAG